MNYYIAWQLVGFIGAAMTWWSIINIPPKFKDSYVTPKTVLCWMFWGIFGPIAFAVGAVGVLMTILWNIYDSVKMPDWWNRPIRDRRVRYPSQN